MTILAHTFDRQRITPASDALLYATMLNNGLANHHRYDTWQYGTNQKSIGKILPGYKDEMKTTINGSNIIVGTGACVVFGRLLEVVEPETIPIPSSATGTVPICVRIDLTQQNTSSGTPGSDDYVAINNQVSIGLVTGTKNEENLAEGGHLYDWKFAELTNAGSGAPGINQRSSVEVAYLDMQNGWTRNTATYQPVILYDGSRCTLYAQLKAPQVKAAVGSLIAYFPLEFAPMYQTKFVVGTEEAYTWDVWIGVDTANGRGHLDLQRFRKGGEYNQIVKNYDITILGLSWYPQMAMDPNRSGGVIL